MKKSNILLLTVLALAIVGIITLVFLDRQSEKSDQTRIGAILPMTGPVAIFGDWIRRGLEIGLEDYESRHPETKGKIIIIVEDSKNEAKDGVAAMTKLVNTDRVDVVVSAMSKVSIPLISISDKLEIPLVLQDVTYPDVTKKGRYVYRHFIQSDREAAILSQYAASNLQLKSAAILYVNDEAGSGAEVAFSKNFILSGSVVAKESFGAMDTDFRPVVEKVIAAGSDCVYLFGNGPSWANCLRTLRQQGYKGVILTNAAMAIDPFRKIAGDEAINGVIFTFPVIDESSEVGEGFVRRYLKKYNEFPSIESAYAFDVVTLICAASHKSVTDSINKNLENTREFNGVFGKTTSQERDFITKITVAKWEDGKPAHIQKY